MPTLNDCPELRKKIGENLEYLRLIKRITIKEMASKLNLSTSAYRNIERGISDINVSKFIIIASILKVLPSEIINIQDEASVEFIEKQSTSKKNDLTQKNAEIIKDILNKIHKLTLNLR